MEKTQKNNSKENIEKNRKTKKKDFIEIKFTGYANGQIFDSNIDEDLKKINPGAKPEKTIVAIGENMVIEGLDKKLESLEIGKEYEINVPCKEAFGERKRELIRTIPLASFRQQKVDPRPGMVLVLDNFVVKIVAVSGARVTTDFNNPLAGKDLTYKITLIRFVEDEHEKAESLFKALFRFIPKFEIKGQQIIVKGLPELKPLIDVAKEKFKELFNKEISFEEDKEEHKHEEEHEGHEHHKEHERHEHNEEHK